VFQQVRFDSNTIHSSLTLLAHHKCSRSMWLFDKRRRSLLKVTHSENFVVANNRDDDIETLLSLASEEI
jgi:hypothetical protein